jgi:hypothetical protein
VETKTHSFEKIADLKVLKNEEQREMLRGWLSPDKSAGPTEYRITGNGIFTVVSNGVQMTAHKITAKKFDWALRGFHDKLSWYEFW